MQHIKSWLICLPHHRLPHRSITLNIMLLSLPFHLLPMSPFKLDVILPYTCHSVASLPLSFFLSQPPSSFTLPSVTPLPCFLPFCREHQWDITVTLCCDASTHSEEHKLHF